MSITLTTPAVVFTLDTVRDGAAVFNADSSTLALPKRLTVRRVLPKKTGSYPGNARNHLKLHFEYDVDGVALPVIAEVSVSRPATMATANTEIVRDILAALIGDPEMDAFFTSLAMPS